ncbi:MAG: YhjD/YihY/BrkB family envelope integrity protein, partial [Pseudomonadota bacterium]
MCRIGAHIVQAMAHANKARYSDGMNSGLRLLMRTWRGVADVLGAIGALNLPAAGVAFFAVLSLVPTLAALVALWGLFADPTRLETALNGISAIAPPEAFAIIE